MKVITKKEKNRGTFILMEDTFSLDFDTGIFYDRDNHEVDCPFAFASLDFNPEETSLYFCNALAYINAHPYLKKEERAIFCSYMERYAALGLRFNMNYDMRENTLFPNYSAFCYILQHTPIMCSSATDIAQKYVARLTDDLQKSFPTNIHDIVAWVASLWCLIGQPRTVYVSLIRLFLREKLHIFEITTITPLITDWIVTKHKLNEPYDSCPSHGFAIELVEAKKRLKARDTAAINEKLQRNNDLPYLYFEDETFICKPLLTCEAFHNEATKQDNCVERLYLDAAARGETHIVSIRRKNDPTSSCITCEIKDYEIIQYLQAHNKKDYKEDESAFKKKLAAHLRAAKS